jgi:putative hydrolases of HD superfamily
MEGPTRPPAHPHPLDPGMTRTDDLPGVLAFLGSAERLKNVTRTSWTSDGHRESVAEHSWRLCLMALVLGPAFPHLDTARLIRLCVIHDLGEAIGGDISATLQAPEGKAAKERLDLLELLDPLPPPLQREILDLWDEYEAASTPEARLAKALDKLETIMQHNQGRTPKGFDFRFNLGYGTEYTADPPLVAEIRRILDQETVLRAEAAENAETAESTEPTEPTEATEVTEEG